ncbi:FtsW/RodA/SpoVE family cell cycle protein [Listeria weihenstephanensis]|uniref:FtsW/RodA/SpoVE family cell cycle protein n=1 Tax=Listeria weihenstephanensis TaxID=1006155 RepID=A0A841Z5H1_9LIST|nr:FtsW/RodA/SpoVE family cell cycle protein [Listeria weihenstephanensis]MBC1500520.1 FtsW/RodA/SpoVE family cell cycle protein [Listeria weihenstephanensis]
MRLEDDFEVYMKELCKKIRNKDVHASLKLEISDHLQTLKEEALLAGLSEEEATAQALARMGDVKSLGKQLNKTHKAPMDIKTLLPVLIASLFGLLVMYYLQFHSTFTELQNMKVFNKSLIFYLVGILLMLGFSWLDYRKLLQYSKHLYVGTVLILLITVIFGVRVDGLPFLILGFANVNFIEITPFLLVISFAGIFHSWNWNDSRKSWLGVGILAFPILLLFTTSALATSIICIIGCIAIMLSSKASIKQTVAYAAATFIWPVFNLVILSQNYTLINTVDIKNLGASNVIGSSLHLTPNLISEVHTDLIFMYIIYSFGWLAAIIAVVLIVFFICRILRAAKNIPFIYGKMLVIGLAVTFASQFILSILTNLGFSPLSDAAMPFMSFGGTHILFEMIALGLILSIFKRRKAADIPGLT